MRPVLKLTFIETADQTHTCAQLSVTTFSCDQCTRCTTWNAMARFYVSISLPTNYPYVFLNSKITWEISLKFASSITCNAQFISLTTKSNCWCSSMALLPTTCCANSVHRASLAAFDFSARRTAGNVFRASDILFSKMQLMQLRNTWKKEVNGRTKPILRMN